MDYAEHRYTSACGRLELFARDYGGRPGDDHGGDRPPLLLMHGLTRNSADFEPLAEHLATDYRLIVPDQRGRGLSDVDPDPANYRPDIYARDMFALLDGLGIENAALIGTSMGGLMAMVMTAAQPDRVKAVVLNDVGPVLDSAGLERIGSYVGSGDTVMDWETAARETARLNALAFPGFDDADWLAFARRTWREGADGTLETAYDKAIADGFADIDDTPQPDLWPLWQALDGKPVLAIRGSLSDLLSKDTLEEMERRHKGVFRSVEVPNRGHAPLLDEPEALLAIRSFLAEYAA